MSSSSHAMYNGAEIIFFRGIGNVITIKLASLECSSSSSRRRRCRFVFSFIANSSDSGMGAEIQYIINQELHILFIQKKHLPDSASSASSGFVSSAMRLSKNVCVSSCGFRVMSGITRRSE